MSTARRPQELSSSHGRGTQDAATVAYCAVGPSNRSGERRLRVGLVRGSPELSVETGLGIELMEEQGSFPRMTDWRGDGICVGLCC